LKAIVCASLVHLWTIGKGQLPARHMQAITGYYHLHFIWRADSYRPIRFFIRSSGHISASESFRESDRRTAHLQSRPCLRRCWVCLRSADNSQALISLIVTMPSIELGQSSHTLSVGDRFEEDKRNCSL